MKVAILYQNENPPMINGILKPKKPGGYSDSGADIAYCLSENGVNIVTPVTFPNINNDYDWVFPDSIEGIERAINLGADTLWLNTVLYSNHPVLQFKGIGIIGQRPEEVSLYDDKYYTNQLLSSFGFASAKSIKLGINDRYTGQYPCIIKPLRGRGSQGVIKCDTEFELQQRKEEAIVSGKYGKEMMVEEFYNGQEITISVFPNGMSLPIVERINHIGGIAPYSGDVPVVENSRVITEMDNQLKDIDKTCCEAVLKMKLKALVRIDCRSDNSGKYYMIDFNLKPNMTGASRPHRMNQDSLTLMAARSLGWSYFDLLYKMIENRWILI